MNKTNNIRDDFLVKGKEGRREKGGIDKDDRNDEIDIFSNQNKKKQIMEALQGNEELKKKL